MATNIVPIEITNTANVNDSDADVFTAVTAGGNEILNDGRSILVIKNTSDPGALRTVTITKQKSSIRVKGSGDITLSNMSIAIDGTGNEYEARVVVPTYPYNDGNGKIQLTYSDSGADLEVAMFRLANYS